VSQVRRLDVLGGLESAERDTDALAFKAESACRGSLAAERLDAAQKCTHPILPLLEQSQERLLPFARSHPDSMRGLALQTGARSPVRKCGECHRPDDIESDQGKGHLVSKGKRHDQSVPGAARPGGSLPEPSEVSIGS